MDTLRIGIIGCGALGTAHARKFASMPGVEVAALAEPDSHSLSRTAAALPIRPGTLSPDYREILDAGLDAVCIATPDGLHVPQLLDALAAGLHVLCEKPLTPDPAEVDAVLASRDEVGKVVALTYPRRWDRNMQAMRREVQSGRWGRVKTITAMNAEDWIRPNAGTWRHDPEMCPGGFLYDANGHQIDTLLWITGLRAEWVEAETEDRGTPSPMVSWGKARLVGGIPMAFGFVGDANGWCEHLRVLCEDADFLIDNMQTFWQRNGKIEPLRGEEGAESGEEGFVRLIREGGVNWAPPEAVWGVLDFTRAALESASSGRRAFCPDRGEPIWIA